MKYAPAPAVVLALGMFLTLAGCTTPARLAVGETARSQVEATERAFAASMADRDLQAFSRHIAGEAIFFTGPAPLRGREQVVAWWSRYFNAAAAPFSWTPDRVEVLAGGTLALSTGPVHDPAGKPTGRFVSIWRQEAPGVWRIVFDRGESAAE